MKLGAEPKKVVLLGGLVVVAGYLLLFSNEDAPRSSSTGPAATRPAPSRPPSPAVRTPATRAAKPRANRGRSRGGQQFRPSLKPPRAEDRPDPMTIDPTLRLDLLAKLQEVSVDGIKRSLFEFGKAPPPKAPEPKILPAELDQIRQKQREAAKKAAQRTTKKPAAPPIRLKFYGFISPQQSRGKRAFFLDGEDIFVAGEGDVIKKGRYRIVRIGVNSAVVEDTEFEHQQTLKLEEARG